MSDSSYDIIFRGDLLPGHSVSEVKPRLMQLFKASATKIDALFNAREVALKRNLDLTSAEKYRAALSRAGVKVELINRAQVAEVKPDAEAARAARLAEQARRRAARRDATATGEKVLEPRSMAERLAQGETALVAEKKAATGEIKATPAVASSSDLSVAPVGSDVLRKEERRGDKAVVVDTSGISLREPGAELLDDVEKAPEVEVNLTTGEFDLAAAGEDILRAGEKREMTEADVDTSALNLDELGADLLRAEERKTTEAVKVDVEGINLAPTGSDLGQIKKRAQVQLPDTSNISLAP